MENVQHLDPGGACAIEDQVPAMGPAADPGLLMVRHKGKCLRRISQIMAAIDQLAREADGTKRVVAGDEITDSLEVGFGLVGDDANQSPPASAMA
jgi:hypothetical protein